MLCTGSLDAYQAYEGENEEGVFIFISMRAVQCTALHCTYNGSVEYFDSHQHREIIMFCYLLR